MEPYNDETPMPWGKHAGEPLGRVPASYLRWCSENLTPDSEHRRALLTYIEENAAAIEMEIAEDLRSHRVRGGRPRHWG